MYYIVICRKRVFIIKQAIILNYNTKRKVVFKLKVLSLKKIVYSYQKLRSSFDFSE